MFKVRYHLQNGIYKNYWQFKNKKEVFYHNPKENVIKLHNCILYNNKNKANKIFLGANKNVCAWIKFNNMEFLEKEVPEWCLNIRYNPKILPYWHVIYNNNHKNLDFMAFDELYLCEKGVFFDNCRNFLSCI